MFGINEKQKEQDLVRKLILEEKIRLYPFRDVYRVYGDTFENRAVLKKMNIVFKEEYNRCNYNQRKFRENVGK